jgi:NitT/TauT family transport system substrate-binding protein
MKPKLFARLILLMALAITLPCAAEEKLEKIYVGVAGLSGALAHAFIPKDTGLYEKFGLDVDLVFFQGGTQGVQSLIAGGVQFAVSSGSEIVAARVAGADVTIVAGYMNTVPYSIVADKRVSRFEDLKGGKAAVSRFGTTSDLAVRYAFEQNGLIPGKDITLVQLGDQGARFAALTGGTVQATVISPPFDLTAKKLGFRILADMADLGLHYQHEALATTERMLTTRPETVRKFLKAFIAGIHVWMTDEKKTKEILARRLRIKDPEILNETYSAYKKLTEKKPYPTLKGIEFQIADLALRNPKAKNAKANTFVNISLLKEIDKSGFIEALYKR